MSALLTLDDARYALGISNQALLSAIERGDLVQVELEGIRGSTRKYVTEASMDAWLARMNGDDSTPDKTGETNASEVIATLQLRISALSSDLRSLGDKVDMAIGRMVGQQERDRRTRLRHTVSARIGDAFDPHGYYVYLLWSNDDETPLYIGRSQNVLSRLGSHMSNTDKRYAVKSVQLIKCSGERTMIRTEAALIREYNPPLNKVGTNGGIIGPDSVAARTQLAGNPE
jgi:predicted GIY-YIG superfamily endonuclease